MGVGRPMDLLEAIARGVDLFDCVMPTRNGRNALAFTDAGPIRLAQSAARARSRSRSTRPAPARPAATAAATCGTCFRRAKCWARSCVSIHNLTYYQRLLAEPGRRSPRTALRRSWRERRRGLGAEDANCESAN